MGVRRLGMLALIAVGVLVFASDLRPVSGPDGGATIAGPYAYLLASSTDLGPSRSADAQLTVTLDGAVRPDALMDWAQARELSVRWRHGDRWAIVEPLPVKPASASGVAL